MVDYNEILGKFKERNVFITGHTGFKGTWMTFVLLKAGANVIGYSLGPPTEPSLFGMTGLAEGSVGESSFTHIIGDVRDRERLSSSLKVAKPDYIFHLAAQPIVRESYKDPVLTFETNVMGTVNLLEAVREYGGEKDGIISVLNVTTDKVYKNNEWCWGYREDDPLGGHDPYSNSKSCSELVTHSYKNAFFDVGSVYEGSKDQRVAHRMKGFMDTKTVPEPLVRVSTARAGNVIGGGDFAPDRIIPDCVRAIKDAYEHSSDEGEIYLRNPMSVRPYQHVLDPVFAYLMIAARQYDNAFYSGYYNVGPDDSSCVMTGELVKSFSDEWDRIRKTDSVSYALPELKVVEITENDAPYESSFLKLDCSKLKSLFGWRPVWDIDEALRKTAEFAEVMFTNGNHENLRDEINRQIELFLNCCLE